MRQLPGIITAVADDRHDDALVMIDDLLEENDPRTALLAMAEIALLMRDTPSSPLPLIGMQWQNSLDGVQIDGESITGADVADELLDVVEGRIDATDTPETQAILDRFDYRPSNPMSASIACTLMRLLLNAMALQRIQRDRTGEAAERAALAYARAAMHGDPNPARILWASEWDRG